MPESEDPKDPEKVTNNDLRNAQFGGGFINADTVNAQRIGGDIWNIRNLFFGQQLAPVGNPQREHNQRLLLADVEQEVASRLNQSLHNAVLINLEKESQPQQVKQLWDAEVKIGSKPPEAIPENTSILEVFDSEEIVGRLLILGAPGAGKTTTLLELAKDLIERAEKKPVYPIPVLFNLSSWKDDHQSISEWLVAELNSKYGVSRKLGKEWVKQRQLLPLLDGLDELESKRQESCVNAINQLLEGEYHPQYLVVCSRSQEYDNYEPKLQLNGAIYLQSLTNHQIHNYLIEVNHADLWQTINPDSELLDLVRTPLLLSITILAFQEISIDRWQQLPSTSDRIQELLDAYVNRMLAQDIESKTYAKKKPPNTRQTRMWLVWLAQQLQKESKTEFLIEEIQPSLLKIKAQKRMYRVISRLIYVLIFGLSFGLLGLYVALPYWLVGLFVVLSFRQSFGDSLEKIELKEQITFLKISKETIVNRAILLILTLIFFMLFLLLVVGNDWRYLGTLFMQNFGHILMPIFGLIPLLIGGQPDFIENKKSPNQGIWKTARNAVFLGLIVGLIGEPILKLIAPPIAPLIGGLSLGLGLGLSNFGGKAVLQHFILRLVLYRNGYIPWNYARFLNYCTERMLLQRVGGRYRFIHKLLQDHFAQMEFTHPK
ncbi:NACHT domain-containing protein [Scytonema sp. PCC 10023]|uniref:NACHT domain-containing protein n=1 Tax=Scytonema sp. PCC 10023 TaxID=1680591 RepID=UPI0039C5D301